MVGGPCSKTTVVASTSEMHIIDQMGQLEQVCWLYSATCHGRSGGVKEL